MVGARCAGAATALLLARRGLRVLALDRSPYRADTLSTHALRRAGVLQLQRLGVLPRLWSAGTPAVRTTAFHYGDEVVQVPIKPRDGVDSLLAPRRKLLDAFLVDAAREAGVDVRHGATAVDLYGYWSGLPVEGYHWYYRPGASAGAIPTNDGLVCLFAAAPAGRFRDELRSDVEAGYHRLLREAAPEMAETVGKARRASGLRGFPGTPGFLRQSFGPGFALVGDAGYFRDPLTAHGITDALRDAELLARAVAGDTDRALADYQAARDDLALGLFTASDEVASFTWDLERLKVLHLSMSEQMNREVTALLQLDGESSRTRGGQAA